MPKAKQPKVTCAKTDCPAHKVLIKSKTDGKKYCVAHVPEGKKAHKKKAKKGGKNSGKSRRRKAISDLLTLNVEDNKSSVISELRRVANFFGQELTLGDKWRGKMVVDVLVKLHDITEEGVGEQERDTKIQEILDSDLPPTVKLSKLVDIEGPIAAMEHVNVNLKKDDHEDEVLDAEELLKEDGDETIGTPQNFEIEELEETADVPDIEVAAPDLDPKTGKPKVEPPTEPEKPKPKIQEAPEERKARLARQANELTKIYKAKVAGQFRPLNEVGQVFYDALSSDVSYKHLERAVMFPKSATAQPESMIDAAKKAMKKTGS